MVHAGRRCGGRRRRGGHGSIPADAALRVTGTRRGAVVAPAACIVAAGSAAGFREVVVGGAVAGWPFVQRAAMRPGDTGRARTASGVRCRCLAQSCNEMARQAQFSWASLRRARLAPQRPRISSTDFAVAEKVATVPESASRMMTGRSGGY